MNIGYKNIDDDIKKEEKSENISPELGLNIRREKKGKIGFVVSKVYIWRKLYTQFKDDQGIAIKLNLEVSP